MSMSLNLKEKPIGEGGLFELERFVSILNPSTWQSLAQGMHLKARKGSRAVTVVPWMERRPLARLHGRL